MRVKANHGTHITEIVFERDLTGPETSVFNLVLIRTSSGRLFAEPVPMAILAKHPHSGDARVLSTAKWKDRGNGSEGGHRPVTVHRQPAGRSGHRSRDVAAPDGGRLQRQRRDGR